MENWAILAPAFALCVLMIFTHTYFGLHVLARGIIFVDLALAQIAALGVSFAFLLGQEEHGLSAQFYALTATVIAAFGFAKLRKIPSKTAREVTIGCVYVVATAISIVILSRSAKGMEELKQIFNGNILWTRWDEIIVVALVYAGVTALHLFYRKKFYALSFGVENRGEASFLWEFLFFASFAIIITMAVNLAGVLLVFAFLIIPAFSASILVDSTIKQLALGWTFGISGSLAGLWVSYNADLPVGATIVSMLGALPIVAVALKYAISGGRS